MGGEHIWPGGEWSIDGMARGENVPTVWIRLLGAFYDRAAGRDNSGIWPRTRRHSGGRWDCQAAQTPGSGQMVKSSEAYFGPSEKAAGFQRAPFAAGLEGSSFELNGVAKFPNAAQQRLSAV